MDGPHLNPDVTTEMKNMVMCFRIQELSILLGYAGLSKTGRKNDLMTRALQLLKSPAYNKAIQAKIVDLYGKRYPRHAPHVRKQYAFLLENELQNEPSRPIVPQHDAYPPPPRKDVPKFKPLTFFEHISEILPTTQLIAKSTRMMQDSSFKFRVTQQQALKVKSGMTRDSKDALKYDLQIQLRFCRWDLTTPQDDVLPANLTVKIDRCTVPLPPFTIPTKSGLEPKRLNRPLNISSFCRLHNRDDFSLEIRWSGDTPKFIANGKSYALAINLVQQLNVDDLLRKLKQLGIAPSSVSSDLVKSKLAKDPESDISLTSLRVSLLCPLGKMRIKLPVRPLTCNHLQCFDANFFLMLNLTKPTWVCPVCDKPANFSDICIDGLFTEILKETNCDEIEFIEDGSWHNAKKKTKTVIIGTPTRPIDLSKSWFNEKPYDGENKRKKIDIIDLTCDSSDDEETPIRIPDEIPPVLIPDGTTPDRIVPSGIDPEWNDDDPGSNRSIPDGTTPNRIPDGTTPDRIPGGTTPDGAIPNRIPDETTPPRIPDGTTMHVDPTPILISPDLSPPKVESPASLLSYVGKSSPYRPSSRFYPSTARSPYQTPSSPGYQRPWHPSPTPPQSKAFDLTRKTPPLVQSSITSHFSRQPHSNVVDDPPPSTHIPSPPQISATPPSVNPPLLPSLPGFDAGMEPFHPHFGLLSGPPFQMNYPSYDYPYFSLPQLGQQPGIPPYIQSTSLPPILSGGSLALSRTQSPSQSDSISQTRGSTHSNSMFVQDFNDNAISID